MAERPPEALPVFDDDDVARVALLARKATRKAARVANRSGYFVEHASDACMIKSPHHALKIALKTSPIDVNKRYTFAGAAH